MSLLTNTTFGIVKKRSERKIFENFKLFQRGKFFLNTNTSVRAALELLSLENVLMKKPCVRLLPTPHPPTHSFNPF